MTALLLFSSAYVAHHERSFQRIVKAAASCDRRRSTRANADSVPRSGGASPFLCGSPARAQRIPCFVETLAEYRARSRVRA
jgi:hypothetical protein